MRDELHIYETLRKSGHTEEQALNETKAFMSASNGNIDELVTKKDLKIAFLEFREENNNKFSETWRMLDLLKSKSNVSSWALGALFAGMCTGFGFVINKLVDILASLPK